MAVPLPLFTESPRSGQPQGGRVPEMTADGWGAAGVQGGEGGNLTLTRSPGLGHDCA